MVRVLFPKPDQPPRSRLFMTRKVLAVVFSPLAIIGVVCIVVGWVLVEGHAILAGKD